MSVHSRFLFISSVCAAVLLMTACNLPTSSTISAPSAAAVHTSAAMTISAQLTSMVTTSQPQLTPSPTGESLVLGQNDTHTPMPSETITPSSTTTPENTATLTATASPTLPLSDPKASLGEPNWEDNFENANNWALYEDEFVRFTIREGQLVMISREAENRDSWMLSWPDTDDFYIEMYASMEECSGLDRYGLIFRSDADTGYLYGLSCDGRYSLRIWDGEEFTRLIDWEEGDNIQIQEGEFQRMGVMGNGDRITLYLNGIQLDEVEDMTFRDGSFGVFIGSPNTENFRVSVDQFSYWEFP